MRNIYLVNLSFGLAGIERRFANIFLALRRRGRVRPILVVPDTLAELLHRAGITEPDPDIWTVTEMPPLRALSRLRTLPRFGQAVVGVLRSRPVAWAHQPVWNRIARDEDAVVHIGMNCSALRPPHVPIVFECVDSTLTQLSTRHYRNARTRPCVVNCQTHRIRHALEASTGGRAARWQTVVSPCCFGDYPAPANGVRDPVLVAFVGRFSPEKQPLLFVEALARVRASGIPARAVMLGEGPLEGAIRSAVQRLGLASAITVGFSTRPAERLAAASVFVSLQTGDNYPGQALLEAMGAGCAVLATDVGDTARLVTPEVGVLTDSSVSAVAERLATLLGDPEQTWKRGQAASRLVRTEHSADRYAQFLEALYARAAEVFAAAGLSKAPGPSQLANRLS